MHIHKNIFFVCREIHDFNLKAGLSWYGFWDPVVFVILGFVYSLIECFSLSSFAFSVFLFPGFIHVPPAVFHVSCLVEFSCLLFPSFSVQSTFLSFSHVSCFNLIVPRLAFSFASSQFHVCLCNQPQLCFPPGSHPLVIL